MFAKNVFGSHLESIICKTKNVCVRLYASRVARVRGFPFPSLYLVK